MQLDFHYYATYCASLLAGYSHEEAASVSYSAQFVDCCTKTYLATLSADLNAATTQLSAELMDIAADKFGIQNITRIWSSFHFLPEDLYLEIPKRTNRYMHKRRLVCGPNGELIVKTIGLANKDSLPSIGIAMHVLADTWAHRYFAGTPSLVINNTNGIFYDISYENSEEVIKPIKFNHNPGTKDVIEECIYTNTVYSDNENSPMNLGHGRAGHLPDISCLRYKYLPAWKEYDFIIKDNPSDYYRAFTQMVYALKCIRNEEEFIVDTYDVETVKPFEDEIRKILNTKKLEVSEEWKNFGEKLSGYSLKNFDINEYQNEYIEASEDDKEKTFLGKFLIASINHKTMVTNAIFASSNPLAGSNLTERHSNTLKLKNSLIFLIRKIRHFI